MDIGNNWVIVFSGTKRGIYLETFKCLNTGLFRIILDDETIYLKPKQYRIYMDEPERKRPVKIIYEEKEEDLMDWTDQPIL